MAVAEVNGGGDWSVLFSLSVVVGGELSSAGKLLKLKEGVGVLLVLLVLVALYLPHIPPMHQG